LEKAQPPEVKIKETQDRKQAGVLYGGAKSRRGGTGEQKALRSDKKNTSPNEATVGTSGHNRLWGGETKDGNGGGRVGK